MADMEARQAASFLQDHASTPYLCKSLTMHLSVYKPTFDRLILPSTMIMVSWFTMSSSPYHML